MARHEADASNCTGLHGKRDQGEEGSKKALLNASESGQMLLLTQCRELILHQVQEMMLRDPKCRPVWKDCPECPDGSKYTVQCEGVGKRDGKARFVVPVIFGTLVKGLLNGTDHDVISSVHRRPPRPRHSRWNSPLNRQRRRASFVVLLPSGTSS